MPSLKTGKKLKPLQKKLIDSFPSLKVSKVGSKKLKKTNDLAQKKDILKNEIQSNEKVIDLSQFQQNFFPSVLEKSSCVDIDEQTHIGLSRLDRWNRAEKLGLCPPIEIKKLL
ncbi:hypothetical protein MERGE_000418 [Pneumocystis wakefieldiae]|uniref:Uncharacterized protein n=1 Tax=Pneumocystis wakefieldiae TaxID=38082 RepID=A0A899FW43_9ASCO|nr:hypothetical protein MERGE_000418 [Pneumocystis wakefieldiae]